MSISSGSEIDSRPTNSSVSDGHVGGSSWILNIGLWFRPSCNANTLTPSKFKPPPNKRKKEEEEKKKHKHKLTSTTLLKSLLSSPSLHKNPSKILGSNPLNGI